MTWYQSATGVYHRGGTSRGTVHTACGIQFLPQHRKDAAEVLDSAKDAGSAGIPTRPDDELRRREWAGYAH